MPEVVKVASESLFQSNSTIIKKEEVESQGKSDGHEPGLMLMARACETKGIRYKINKVKIVFEAA